MSEIQFTLSAKAVNKVKEALDERGTPNAFLRIGIRGGGCAGYSYHLEYSDSEPREQDLVYEFDDVKVVIDKKSILYLNGAELDWVKTLMYQGFKFNNPIAKGTCGCNKSFTL